MKEDVQQVPAPAPEPEPEPDPEPVPAGRRIVLEAETGRFDQPVAAV